MGPSEELLLGATHVAFGDGLGRSSPDVARSTKSILLRGASTLRKREVLRVKNGMEGWFV